MIVLCTEKELNTVIQHINPNYPKQNLKTIETNEYVMFCDCVYFLSGVKVEIMLREEEP